MKRKLSGAGAAFLLIVSAAQLAAQFPPSADTPSRWIPFTAKLNETYSFWKPGPVVGGGHYQVVQVVGLYARNESGDTLERWLYRLSPESRIPNIGFLIDRQAGAKLEINYELKNIRRSSLERNGHPEFAAVPMTWEVFLKSHALDTPLGNKIVAEIECVDYRIHDDHAVLKMYREEVCFAPSLNFIPIKYKHLYPKGRDVTVQMGNIQIGVPDPELFHIPTDFANVH